ncbi:hypothetical protein K443DRAFT_103895 [Laccaria amethystina LaAM-08-1]|jgi:hypothetical protein|uniref:Uncharacterized protein n=1 Tax=Laccaria amethystina LaAM-08-1 TaxID=1095629 RepID=A0A0C9XRB2_9AGAR|nr:hypothetical protein K443DRAFT_103895 [Laccaria amethystina LaAM-08-1]
MSWHPSVDPPLLGYSHTDLELRDAPETSYGRRSILRKTGPLPSRNVASEGKYPRAVEDDDMYARALVDKQYPDAVYIRALDDDDLDLYVRIEEGEDMEARYFDDEDLYYARFEDEDDDEDEVKTRYFDAEDLYEQEEEGPDDRDLDEELYERDNDEITLRDEREELDARMEEIEELLASMGERTFAGGHDDIGLRSKTAELEAPLCSSGSCNRRSRLKSPLFIRLRDNLEQQMLSRTIEFGDDLFF